MSAKLLNPNFETEKHPWNWFVPPGSRTMIIGTFPSALKNRRYDFYYPNPANLFWRMMAEIAGTSLKYFSGDEAVEERKKILEVLSVAITDMGKVVIRHHGSSLDEHLEVKHFMEIFTILREHPSIKKIIFTSSSGKSSAASWFIEYLRTMKQEFRFPKGVKPVHAEFKFDDRIIKLVIAYSPSPRAANRISFSKLTEIYKNEIMENDQ